MKIHKPLLILLTLAALLAGLTTGCSGASAGGESMDMEMASQSEMPAEVQAAPVSVREAYQFAAANPDVLTELPCYCGCGPIGHTSNYACYVSGEEEDGSLVFDAHALGCSICVDITQDAMRLLKQGTRLPEIRSYIDNTYSRYGPSNMP